MQAVIKIKAMGVGFFGLIWFGVFCWVFCVLVFFVGFAFEVFFSFVCVLFGFCWFCFILKKETQGRRNYFNSLFHKNHSSS